MSSTYLSLHYHIVFGTKKRKPYLDQNLCERMHEYLGGIIRSMDGYPQIIGGTADHIHMLIGLKGTHCIADVLREVKKNSSMWAHKTIGEHDFEWQEGYAAFTVSATACAGVKRYIAHQEIHHRRMSFKEELIELLEKAGVTYDPRYLE